MICFRENSFYLIKEEIQNTQEKRMEMDENFNNDTIGRTEGSYQNGAEPGMTNQAGYPYEANNGAYSGNAGQENQYYGGMNQGGFQGYPGYQNGYPGYQNGYPGYYQMGAPEGYEEPVTVGEWIITLLLWMVPCVNIILMFVWAFSKTEKKSKSNFCKAQLIMMGIVLGIYLLIAFLVIVMGVGIGSSFLR